MSSNINVSQYLVKFHKNTILHIFLVHFANFFYGSASYFVTNKKSDVKF